MTETPDAPGTAEALRAAIFERHDRLSKRLQQIARYVLDEPNELALDTLAVIAERIGVQPSAIVRFAQHTWLRRLPTQMAASVSATS